MPQDDMRNPADSAWLPLRVPAFPRESLAPAGQFDVTLHRASAAPAAAQSPDKVAVSKAKGPLDCRMCAEGLF